MALVPVASGQQATAVQVQQLIDLLTGVMGDQAVTVANILMSSVAGAQGAGATSRNWGRTSTPGAPVGAPPIGTNWAVGDTVMDSQFTTWVCIVAGNPGTWQATGMSLLATINHPTSSTAVTWNATAGPWRAFRVTMRDMRCANQTVDSFLCRFNGDASSINYTTRRIDYNSTGAFGGSSFGTYPGVLAGLLDGTGWGSYTDVTIAAATSIPLSLRFLQGLVGLGAGSYYWESVVSGAWLSGSAITSLTFIPLTANLQWTGTLDIYGIP